MSPQPLPSRRRSQRGFTLVEVMISMSIVVLTLSLALGTFVFGLKLMYKDSQRLTTNANLRYFVSQVSKETLDASEFYIFPTYEALDGSVDITNDVTSTTTQQNGIDIYHGDCLVLVTRVTLDVTANVRQFRIYYRKVTDSNNEGSLVYWESPTYPGAGSTSTLKQLLDAVNLKSNPNYVGSGSSRVLATRSRGRPKPSGTNQYYPIFSSEWPTISKTNESVAINVEIINGTSVNNLLSSSSFNYTISPRR